MPNPIDVIELERTQERRGAPDLGQVRMLSVATALVFCLAVITVFTGAAEAGQEARLATAAEIETLSFAGTALADAPGYRLDLEIDINGTKTKMQGLIAGTSGEFTLDIPGRSEPVTLAFDPTGVYLPAFGGGWVAYTAPGLDDPAAASALIGDDPLAALDAIGAADIVFTGTETIDGVETSRYETELSYTELLSADPIQQVDLADPQVQALIVDAEPVTLTAWVGNDGVVRRLRTKAKLQGITATTTATTTPLATAPALTLPPTPIVGTRSFETLAALVEAATLDIANL